MSKPKIIKWNATHYPEKRTSFHGVRNVADQRCMLQSEKELYETYFNQPMEDYSDELDAEHIDDFDDDVYEYYDRADYGVDIALAQNLPPPKFKKVR